MSSTWTVAPAAAVETAPLRLIAVADGEPATPAVAELVRRNWAQIESVRSVSDLAGHPSVGQMDGVLVVPAEQRGDAALEAELRELSETLTAHRLGAVLIWDRRTYATEVSGNLIMRVPARVSVEELYGRLSAIAFYRPRLAEMEYQLDNMQRLGKRLNLHFVELDQEMRLASRLQRDFLPRDLPTVGGTRFATLFRPASWVSGDIFDVYRIDETHVGFYIADVVGHGVAAGLLTMFIKQAVQSKNVRGNEYDIIPPDATMARLNESLVRQKLPNCQFVTACHCVLDTRTNEVRTSRAGHPYPLHITADGTIQEVKSEGGLLGVFEDSEFPLATVRLKPGEKFVLYSDGLEPTIFVERDQATHSAAFAPAFAAAARLPGESFVLRVSEILDGEEGSLNPRDDNTLVVLEVAS